MKKLVGFRLVPFALYADTLVVVSSCRGPNTHIQLTTFPYICFFGLSRYKNTRSHPSWGGANKTKESVNERDLKGNGNNKCVNVSKKREI